MTERRIVHQMAATSSPDHHTGLTQVEAARRLAEHGPNELPGGRKRSLPRVVANVLREPMLLLLLAAGLIYLLLGDLNDALILLAFAGLTIGITVFQEARTERAIGALRDLSMPQAIVIREGRKCTIPSREVVNGDLLLVNEGGRIVADGWLLAADTLQADEAILTGESVPVTKLALSRDERLEEAPLPGGDGVPYAFSGTMVVRGSGLLEVAATGAATRIGEIGQSLATLETEPPRLVLQSRGLVRWCAVGGIGISLLAVMLFGLLRGGWLEALLSGIAIAMSLLPEELPVVLALFMTMGALRMSRSRVLARRGTAIETLGAATVVCTDKTGTLTQNQMEIVELRLPTGTSCRPGEGSFFSPEFAALAQTGLLACAKDPFDPMEKAFHALAEVHHQEEFSRPADGHWDLHHQYALSPELLAMSQVWSRDGEDGKLIAAKGAPEAIAGLCRLDDKTRQWVEQLASDMAARGLRVLGVAHAEWNDGALPQSQRNFAFSFAGLVGLEDPIRPSVPGAVHELQGAGIRVVMITGDYPATARAIAAQAGIAPGAIMTGEELAHIDDSDLVRRIGAVAIFARVMPEQKLRIVRGLKEIGEVVAMTGDGVNDAPSLKAANIGVAMGRQRGTDVAREASSIVLLDDDFGAIVTAVRLGRRIYDNIRKATGFIFAVHLPIAGLALAPLLIGWPLILGPAHIALIEMVIDPVCSLAFEAEPEEDDIMRRKPRDPESKLVSRSLLAWSTLQGVMALLAALAVAYWANHVGKDEEVVRATCFAALIACIFVLIFVNRSYRVLAGHHRKRHNFTLAAISALIAMIYVPLLLIPQAAGLFRFAVLDLQGIVAVAMAAMALLAALSALKTRFPGPLQRPGT